MLLPYASIARIRLNFSVPDCTMITSFVEYLINIYIQLSHWIFKIKGVEKVNEISDLCGQINISALKDLRQISGHLSNIDDR